MIARIVSTGSDVRQERPAGGRSETAPSSTTAKVAAIV
jgi:hypothetical protein